MSQGAHSPPKQLLLKKFGAFFKNRNILNIFSCFFSSFQCIQACDYDETKLVTGENLVRHRKTKFAHLSLKHITLLGIVRIKKKAKTRKNKKSAASVDPPRGASAFLFDEAAVAEDYEAEEEEEEDNDYDEDMEELSSNSGDPTADEILARGMSESEFDSDSESDSGEGTSARPSADFGDLGENLVCREEEEDEESATALFSDHSYSCVRKFGGQDYSENRTFRLKSNREWRKKAKYKYSFLYALSSSGVTKRIKNCIPKAVAILSNSKKIILNHVAVLLDCLDPRLAELCYMDTDSCLLSLTHENLEENILPEKMNKWQQSNILADEGGAESCHGKLKLEGTFRVGFFKGLKIYRLFTSLDFEKEMREKICYTRCKGVNRNIAKIIPNSVFEKSVLDKTVVHRSCLRPSRTGEMLIAHECRSLAAPFNLKRHVTDDGLHSFPVSYIADGGEEEDDDVDDD